ncbi:hypothetical protein [Streptomyces mirabilis]|uniref:hypothetical protein n=1 Tax=Streptomyces mirabilis TaxID=68239 RepID=UPI00333418C9
MPKPYPEEFREDVVRVARNRGPDVTLEQVAAAFGPQPVVTTTFTPPRVLPRPSMGPPTRR